MCSKIIFVLAMVYTVNASVLTDNVSHEDPDTEAASDARACNLRACEQLCRRLKLPGGACVNGRCMCDNFLVAEDGDFENPMSGLENSDLHQGKFPDVAVETSLNWCDVKACNWMCHRLNKTSGSCVEGRCNCEKSHIAEDVVDEYSELDSRRVCRLSRCNRTCTRRGYEGATCVKGRCKCYNNTTTALPVSELSEDQPERSCNMQACDQLCHRLKFRGGVCVNGRCKCDNFLGIDAEAVDEYSELDSRRVCKLRQCNRTCARRGYATARCINGWCYCYKKIKREDVSPLENVTSDENDETNQILKNGEELIKTTSTACNTLSCNQRCQHLNSIGGWCHLGQCQCFKH